MPESLERLILDLLEWLRPGPRPYDEVLELWRTSCPRLSVWEDARLRGYIGVRNVPGGESLVSISNLGIEHLEASRHLHLT